MTTTAKREEFGVIKLSSLTELDIYKLVIYDMPLNCVKNLALRKIGDFCLVRTPEGFFVCALTGSEDNRKAVYLKLKQKKSMYSFYGFVTPTASSLQNLFHELNANANKHFTLFSDVLNSEVILKNLVTYQDLVYSNIYLMREIKDRVVVSNDQNYVLYSGKMMNDDNNLENVSIMESSGLPIKKDFRRRTYEEMCLKKTLEGKRLPTRLPIAAILEPTQLIYKDVKGFTLDNLLDSYQYKLDLTQRTKICASCVRIMSELHNENFFHGGIMPSNFFAAQVDEKDGVKQMEILYNGSDGLVAKGKEKKVRLIDYNKLAPEIAFTRTMTPESGVYNIGKLFEFVLTPDLFPAKYARTPIPEEPMILNKLRRLIHVTTRPNPMHRPTMNGVVLLIRQILTTLPPSNAKLNFVHFDQSE